jgi:hypothetical protein
MCIYVGIARKLTPDEFGMKATDPPSFNKVRQAYFSYCLLHLKHKAQSTNLKHTHDAHTQRTNTKHTHEAHAKHRQYTRKAHEPHKAQTKHNTQNANKQERSARSMQTNYAYKVHAHPYPHPRPQRTAHQH